MHLTKSSGDADNDRTDYHGIDTIRAMRDIANTITENHHNENFCKTEQMEEPTLRASSPILKSIRRAQDANRLFRTIIQILRKLFPKVLQDKEDVHKTA
jgi:hypothetical protein